MSKKVAIFCFDMYEYFSGEQLNATELYKLLKQKGFQVKLVNIVTSPKCEQQVSNLQKFGEKYAVACDDQIYVDASSKTESIKAVNSVLCDKAVFCGVALAFDKVKAAAILKSYNKKFFLFARISYAEVKHPENIEVFKAADSNEQLVASLEIDVDKLCVKRWNEETGYPDFSKKHIALTVGMLAYLLSKSPKKVIRGIDASNKQLELVAASRMCKVKNVLELADVSFDVEESFFSRMHKPLAIAFYGEISASEKEELLRNSKFVSRYRGPFVGGSSKDPRRDAIASYCSVGYVQDVDSYDERDIKLVQSRRVEVVSFEALALGSIPIMSDAVCPVEDYPFQLDMLNNRPETVDYRTKQLVAYMMKISDMTEDERTKFCKKWYKKFYKVMLHKSSVRRLLRLLKL